MESLRKRNASDGDSGFDSALSSRSSSISLEESQELLGYKISKVEVDDYRPPLREKFAHILDPEEDIRQDVGSPDLYIIKDRNSGRETLYKPPTRLSFSNQHEVGETFSAAEYNRCNPIPRSQLFNSRLQLELEKQVAKLDLLEVNLLMDTTQVPPPSLGIRVVGVNMIHGVPDKLNIYVKRVMEGSVAGLDGRIHVNDHIVEVNGISLVGVSQKLAAEALSSCAINPDTGVVNFVLAREKEPAQQNLAPEEQNPTPVETDSAPSDPSLTPEPSEAGMDSTSSSISLTLSESSPEEPPVPLEPSVPLEPPVSLILTPASLSGESKVFIPVPAPAPPPLSLSELPPDLILRIARLLSPRDRSRLRKVNKSFSAALTNAGPAALTNDGPATTGGGGQPAPSYSGDQNFPPKKENPPPDQSKIPSKNCENRQIGSEPLPGKLKTPPSMMETVGDVSPLRTSSAEARGLREGVNRNLVPLLSSLS